MITFDQWWTKYWKLEDRSTHHYNLARDSYEAGQKEMRDRAGLTVLSMSMMANEYICKVLHTLELGVNGSE